MLAGSGLRRAHCKMNSRTLVIDIQFQRARELCAGLLELLKAEMTKAHHIEAVHPVALVQIILEYQEVRERNSEVVNAHMVEKVLLSVIDQLIEAAFGLLYVSRFEPRQSLIENHIRWLVIVKHCAGRFFEPLRCGGEVFGSLFDQAKAFIRTPQIVVNVVFLGTCQFAFAEVFWV